MEAEIQILSHLLFKGGNYTRKYGMYMKTKYALFRLNFLLQILSKITGAYNPSLNQSKPETRIPSKTRHVINNHVFLPSEFFLNKKTKYFMLHTYQDFKGTYL